MAGLDGLQSAGPGPRLGMSGFQDARAPLRSPQNPLPWTEPPSVVGTTSRSPLLICILGTPITLSTSACPLDHGTVCMLQSKPGAPTGTGTGSSYLAL